MRDWEPLVNVKILDIDKPPRQQLDERIRAAGRADAERAATVALEGEPALADESAGVAARLGVHVPENLDDELIGKIGVD